jgi:hypothetical protein
VFTRSASTSSLIVKRLFKFLIHTESCQTLYSAVTPVSASNKTPLPLNGITTMPPLRPKKTAPLPPHKVYNELHGVKRYVKDLSSLESAPESGTVPSLSKRGISTAEHFVPEVIKLFPWMAEILEKYLTSAEDSHDRSAAITTGQKSILRHALSHASSFVFIVLYIFFPDAPYEDVTENHCQRLYASFLNSVTHRPSTSNPSLSFHQSPAPDPSPSSDLSPLSNPSPSSNLSPSNHHFPTPVLYDFLQTIQEDKKELRRLSTRIVQRSPWNRVYVHRFKDYQKLDSGPTQHPSIGKQVVLDCADEDSFPHNTYYHLKSDDIYRVRPTDDVTPQIHIFASSDPSDGAPSDETIIAMMEAKDDMKGGRESITDQGWYYGAVVYNLFKGDSWLERRNKKSASQLALNVEHRRKIIRGKERHGTSGPMVGHGFRADQGGGVNQYSNLIHELDDDGKWELEMASDHCFEFFLTVRFHTNKLTLIGPQVALSKDCSGVDQRGPVPRRSSCRP